MADILTVNHRLLKSLLLDTFFFGKQGGGEGEAEGEGRVHNRGEALIQ